MQQPQKFIDLKRPNFVCKLNKAIYGLKQVLRVWFSELSSWLLNYSFSASKADSSLFIYHQQNLSIFILIYVDDIIITSFCSFVVEDAFFISNLGRLSYFHDLELDYLPHGLLISQRKYILQLLIKTNMLAANPISSPMFASTKLSKFDSSIFDNVTLSRSTIWSLLYLSLT